MDVAGFGAGRRGRLTARGGLTSGDANGING